MDILVVAIIPSQIPLSLLVILKPSIVSLLLVSNVYYFSFSFLNKSLIFKLLLSQPPLSFLLKQFWIPFTPKKILNDNGAKKENKIPNEIYYINISTIFRRLNQSFTT